MCYLNSKPEYPASKIRLKPLRFNKITDQISDHFPRLVTFPSIIHFGGAFGNVQIKQLTDPGLSNHIPNL